MSYMVPLSRSHKLVRLPTLGIHIKGEQFTVLRALRQIHLSSGFTQGEQNAPSPCRIGITYPGTNNYSQFTYDGLDRCVDIVETSGGSVTSTKQFVWCGNNMCEARNAVGAITAQYFLFGQTISSSNYFQNKDYLGSVRELTDGSGNIQAQYGYDPHGQVTKLQGVLASDLQYAGYYYHAPSGLSLTPHRLYSSKLGRWISRDPIGEASGTNLYAYVTNDPILFTDILGLFEAPPNRPPWWPPNWPWHGGGGGAPPPGRDKDRCKNKDRDTPPPRKPPPPPPKRDDDNGCHPPIYGTSEAEAAGLEEYLDCWFWCRSHCEPSKVAGCQIECGLPEWRYPRPPGHE